MADLKAGDKCVENLPDGTARGHSGCNGSHWIFSGALNSAGTCILTCSSCGYQLCANTAVVNQNCSKIDTYKGPFKNMQKLRERS